MKLGFLTDSMGYRLKDSFTCTHIKVYEIQDGALHEEKLASIEEKIQFDAVVGRRMDKGIKQRINSRLYLQAEEIEWVSKALEGYVLGTVNLKKI